MLIKNWFKSPECWCQRHAAVDANGEETGCSPSNLSKICGLCLYGAVYMFYPQYDDRERIFKAIREEIGQECIGGWNDTHGFDDVVALVEKLEI